MQFFSGKQHTQENIRSWTVGRREKTIYKAEGQPLTGIPVFRVSPIDRDGKVKIIHCNQVLPISTNIETSENKVDQEVVDGPQDCIQAIIGSDPKVEDV